jgi:hypothetical protein
MGNSSITSAVCTTRSHRRYAQRSLLPIGLRNIHPTHRTRFICSCSQIFFEPRQPLLSLPVVLLEPLHIHSVHAGGSPVGDHPPERCLQDFLAAYLPYRLRAGLRLLSAPLQPSPFSGLCRRLRLSPHADRSSGLSRLPFPTCHLRRHRQSDKQTPTVVRSVPDRLHPAGIDSSLWLHFFRCSLIWSSLSLWPISSEDAPLAASASRPHSGHLFRS